MRAHPDFDTSTSCHERTLDEMWLPFDEPSDRQMRDLIWGSNPDEFDAMAAYEEEQQARRYWEELQARIPRIDLFGDRPSAGKATFVVGPVVEGQPTLRREASAPEKFARRSRQPTEYISRDELIRVHQAIRFANFRGAVLNVALTIPWQLGGYETPSEVDDAFEGFMQRFRKFAEHRGIEPRYYAVFENGDEVGYHSHIHLHYPHHRRKELREWLKTALWMRDKRSWPARKRKCSIYKETNFVAQHKWFAYVMKGVNPKLLPSERAAFGLEVTLNKLAEVRQEQTGEVAIKRVRIARSLGIKAQQRVAWINPHPITCVSSEGKRFDDSEHVRGIRTRMIAEVSEAMRRMHEDCRKSL